MFEFFIALFGITYYIGRYAYDKVKLSAYDKSHAARESICDYIESTMTTSPQHEQDIKDYINSGDNYEDICEKFEEDFQFVFGSEWRSLLSIPHPRIFYSKGERAYIPSNHKYWVYHLILASEGKVDSREFRRGYPISAPPSMDIQVKFSQCIERRLHTAGKTDMILVYEKETQQMKFQSLSLRPHVRLW